MRALSLIVLLLLAPLVACDPAGGDPRPSCDADAEVATNSLLAVVDGADWEGTSSGYQVSGVGLLAAFTLDATNSMSLRLVRSTVFDLDDEGVIHELEGDDVEDVLSDGTYPVDFELGSSADEGADVTFIVDNETLHTGEGDGGFLRITSFGDEDTGAPVLRGCMFFHAETQDAAHDAELQSGSFALLSL